MYTTNMHRGVAIRDSVLSAWCVAQTAMPAMLAHKREALWHNTLDDMCDNPLGHHAWHMLNVPHDEQPHTLIRIKQCHAPNAGLADMPLQWSLPGTVYTATSTQCGTKVNTCNSMCGHKLCPPSKLRGHPAAVGASKPQPDG